MGKKNKKQIPVTEELKTLSVLSQRMNDSKIKYQDYLKNNQDQILSWFESNDTKSVEVTKDQTVNVMNDVYIQPLNFNFIQKRVQQYFQSHFNRNDSVDDIPIKLAEFIVKNRPKTNKGQVIRIIKKLPTSSVKSSSTKSISKI